MNENMESDQPKLLEIDRVTFIERAKAFNDEEWDILLMLADTRKIKAEYYRRTDKVWELFDSLNETLSKVSQNTTTEDMEDVIKALKKILKQKE